MKLYVETFGCQMNVADSQEMAAAFTARGFSLTLSPEDADCVLVNTCTVRQHAEDKAKSYLGRLKEWKAARPARKIVVAGCAAERLQKSLKKRFPHVDAVIGAKRIEEFPEAIEPLFKESGKISKADSNFTPSPHPSPIKGEGEKGDKSRYESEQLPARSGQKTNYDWFNESESAFGEGELRTSGHPFVLGNNEDTAFVTVMRGCNYSCSYCIVPSVRGRERYRAPEVILQEARARLSQGAGEVMLLGQTVNSYWHRSPEGTLVDFSDLLRKVDELPGVRAIRFMSPHPHYMSEKLLLTLGGLRHLSPMIHLPVQSGSDRILSAMKRNYTRAEYSAIAGRLRAAVPDLQLGTDLIVGFPGESDRDFEETLSLVREAGFSAAYCFKYSPRPGTEAAKLPDDVPSAEKEKRLALLLDAVEGTRSRKRPERLGSAC